MKVTLVRHGAVEEAYKGCYNGHIDISLSQEGRVQSQELGKRLADESFDAIFCSDLLRAKETLQAMWQNSFDALEVHYTPMLREKSWGRHEGMDFATICDKEAVCYTSFEEWIELLDGESLEEFTTRVENFFSSLFRLHEKKSLLIVTHAGVIAVLRTILQHISFEEALHKNISCGDHVVFRF